MESEDLLLFSVTGVKETDFGLDEEEELKLFSCLELIHKWSDDEEESLCSSC